MKQISIFKVIFFLLVILPVAIFVLSVFIIPLVVILLILSIFWSGKVFRFGTFRQKPGSPEGYWQEEKMMPPMTVWMWKVLLWKAPPSQTTEKTIQKKILPSCRKINRNDATSSHQNLLYHNHFRK